MVFDSTDECKEVLRKYAKLWDGIKNEIETKNGGKAGEYGKHFMKIKLNSDDDLPLNKQWKFPTMKMVVRAVFEDSKYYPQVYLDECLHELQALEYDRIGISEEIDISKTNASK